MANKPCAAAEFGCKQKVALAHLTCPHHWGCLPIGLRKAIMEHEEKNNPTELARMGHLVHAVLSDLYKSPCLVCGEPSMGRPKQCCSKRCRKRLNNE